MSRNSRSPLTQADKDAAARLQTLFEGWQQKRKAAGLPYSQQAAGDILGMTQGAVWQYLNARIALGFLAARKFARMIGCEITELRPEWENMDEDLAQVAELREDSAQYQPDPQLRLRIEQLVNDFQGLTRRQQDDVLRQIADMKHQNDELLREFGHTRE